MGAKYKVVAGEQFLGHYHAKSPLEAVKVAIQKNYAFHKDVIEDPNTVFTAQKGSMNPMHKFAANGQEV